MDASSGYVPRKQEEYRAAPKTVIWFVNVSSVYISVGKDKYYGQKISKLG